MHCVQAFKNHKILMSVVRFFIFESIIENTKSEDHAGQDQPSGPHIAGSHLDCRD